MNDDLHHASDSQSKQSSTFLENVASKARFNYRQKDKKK